MREGPRRPIGPEDPAREVDREIGFHLEMRAREFEAQGLSPVEARRAAEESFGNLTEVREACRAERRRRRRSNRWRRVFGDIGGDVRIAARMLRRDPSFAAAAILVLAVGIGSVVVVGGLIDAYLVRGLPYPEAERLAFVNGRSANAAPDWQNAPAVLEIPISWDLDMLSIVGGERPERASTSWVSAGYFEALGVETQLGRLPDEIDSLPGAPTVAIISHALWQRRWAGDRNVIGRTFTAYSADRPDEAEVFTIIGVLSADSWHFNRGILSGTTHEVLSPLRVGRGTYMARLARGVTVAHAQAVLRADAYARGADSSSVDVVSAQAAYVQQVRPILLALGAAVLLVLVIACGNAAVLLLVRASSREREFSMRVALGAGVGRLARQLVVEGLVLALAASLLGTVLGALAMQGTAGLAPRMLGAPLPGGPEALRLQGTALASAVAACVIAGLLFGLAPLFGTLRPDLARRLAEGMRASEGRARGRLRDVLVGVELALSLALLVGAGLLVRSATHIQRLTLGFEPEDIAAIDVTIRRRSYPDDATRAAFFQRVQSTIEDRLPGMDVELALWAPFARLGADPVETPAAPAAGSDAPPAAMRTLVSPGYFDLMGITLLRGRVFDVNDRDTSRPVAVVSASLARRLWPDRNPLGEQIRFAARPGAQRDEPRWMTVVGVVDEVRKTLTEENPPDLYRPVAQGTPTTMELLLRDVKWRERLDDVRAAVWSLDSEIPLDGVRELQEGVALASLPTRSLAGVLAGFAAFAAVLATLGLYGVISYAVSRSRRDIAVRMALGAEAHQVVTVFLRRILPVLLAGLVAGILGGVWLARLLSSQLHGVTAVDTATYVMMSTVLIFAALLATVIPALRAARLAPMRVLRTD
jgi:putative ABC transport system permease protein